MIENKIRNGNITSSEIIALTTNGKAKGTYVLECNFERRLNRSITTEVSAKPLTWGKLLESIVFRELGLEYTLSSNETLQHPEIDCWVGSPDGRKFDEGGTVTDIKSPYTLKSFCLMVQPLYDGLTGMDAMNAVRETHSDGEKYYWQLVSNACITGSKYAELIVFMPYESQLQEVKVAADGEPNAMFIQWASELELPYIPDNGYYKNLNIIRFEVPQEDKDFLTERVLAAKELLIPYYEKEPTDSIA